MSIFTTNMVMKRLAVGFHSFMQGFSRKYDLCWCTYESYCKFVKQAFGEVKQKWRTYDNPGRYLKNLHANQAIKDVDLTM